MHHVRYLNNFSRKWSTRGAVLDGTWWALKHYHFPLVGSGWLLSFLDGLWMVADISWGSCAVVPGGLCMVASFLCALFFVSLEECGSGNV